MSGKVIITTPYPTPDEVAAYYKIPAKRVAELRQMINEIRAADAAKANRKKNGHRKATTSKSSTRRKSTSSKR
ncbi:MAG: hypothetical protein JO093_05575 [Acidobacteria bacterium]|nr:hypothetical protein [Acidobacteriota bacterium]MBV9068251.1 hypothetical protein [Acidobacteriota bacterium]MBV9185067.1 hypothetical protein [Acidobacteriota bacterium]